MLVSFRAQNAIRDCLFNISNEYQNPQLRSLLPLVLEKYESYQGLPIASLSEVLGKTILDTNYLQLQEHQKENFHYKWYLMLKELNHE